MPTHVHKGTRTQSHSQHGAHIPSQPSQVHAHAHAHADTHTQMQACTHAHTHTVTHKNDTHTHMHAPAHTCIHTCTHTRTRDKSKYSSEISVGRMIAIELVQVEDTFWCTKGTLFHKNATFVNNWFESERWELECTHFPRKKFTNIIRMFQWSDIDHKYSITFHTRHWPHNKLGFDRCWVPTTVSICSLLST